MRPEKWFISNLDDLQRKVVVQSINDSIVVQGRAGSGKTNLAIHRASMVKRKGSYAVVVLTVGLYRMIQYGMRTLELDEERVTYRWAFDNSGFYLSGYVYQEIGQTSVRGGEELFVYLVNGDRTRKFKRIYGPCRHHPTASPSPSAFGLDFDDYVDRTTYDEFGRRASWFEEVPNTESIDITDSEKYKLIPSGRLYRQIGDKIDYLIVDESQDFTVQEYNGLFLTKNPKGVSLFGDPMQRLGPLSNLMNTLTNDPHYKPFELEYTYRLPKSIARVAQKIPLQGIDLLTDNRKDGGLSDFPHYPKPVITKYNTEYEELDGIIDKIHGEDMDNVAILVPTPEIALHVYLYLLERGEKETQIRLKMVEPSEKTRATFASSSNENVKAILHNMSPRGVFVDSLDFTNNDVPCILDYFSAKGSEFDNVFVPFASTRIQYTMGINIREAFYVACTRSSKNLYISFIGKMTCFLDKVDLKNDVEYKDATAAGAGGSAAHGRYGKYIVPEPKICEIR